MVQLGRPGVSVQHKRELWQRCKDGQSLSQIARDERECSDGSWRCRKAPAARAHKHARTRGRDDGRHSLFTAP